MKPFEFGNKGNRIYVYDKLNNVTTISDIDPFKDVVPELDVIRKKVDLCHWITKDMENELLSRLSSMLTNYYTIKTVLEAHIDDEAPSQLNTTLYIIEGKTTPVGGSDILMKPWLLNIEVTVTDDHDNVLLACVVENLNIGYTEWTDKPNSAFINYDDSLIIRTFNILLSTVRHFMESEYQKYMKKFGVE